MPHSVSSNDPTPRDNDDDEVLPDAPAAEAENNETASEQKTETGIKLEDLFAGGEDDDDDEFPASSAPHAKITSSPPPALAPTPAPYVRRPKRNIMID